MNLARNLENTAGWFPERVAVIEGDRRWSYAELAARAAGAAAGLAGLGVGPGDRVALCAPNSAAWLAVYFGALKLGATVVTLSPLLTPPELRRLLAHSRPRAVFTEARRREHLAGLAEQDPPPKLICPGGDCQPDDLCRPASEPQPARERERHEVAAILYTGGTTGEPKGVMLTHENLVTAAHQVAHYERSTVEDRALCFLPFNHVFGQVHIMNATILSGGGLVLLPGFEPAGVLAAIAEHRVTKLYAVPTIYVRLSQVADIAAKLGPVRYCFSAAASMAGELVRRWKDITGLDIFEAYGMTESASLVTYNHYHHHRLGSVGTPAGTTEVSIRDERGRVLPPGSRGEICIRGRTIMAGYLDNPAATRAAFHGDWFRSGDVGYLDPDGYLFIVDRIKDLIITGGENVYPREVEEVLCRRPEVAECAVIGLPDPEYGERVAAYIVPRPGSQIDPVHLRSFLKEHLSPFKVPKQLVSVPQLPTSPAGKILKRRLRQEVLAQDEARRR